MQITLLRDNVELVTNSVNHTLPTTSTLFSCNNSPRMTKNQDGRISNGPVLNARSKIFELSSICDIAKVCITGFKHKKLLILCSCTLFYTLIDLHNL